jgi:gluconolactonase
MNGHEFSIGVVFRMKIMNSKDFPKGRPLFAVVTPGIPDGLKVDSAGRVYSSSAEGLKVFNSFGDLIGAVQIYNVANFAFGGPENNIIYALNDSAIYAVYLHAKGAIQQN